MDKPVCGGQRAAIFFSMIPLARSQYILAVPILCMQNVGSVSIEARTAVKLGGASVGHALAMEL